MAVRFYPTVELSPGADLAGAQPAMWSWTDLTLGRYVHESDGITITRGRRDRYTQAPPSSCALTLLNPAGIWVPDNPLGTYYGRLDQNTPLRVLMRPNDNRLSDAFGRTASSSWGSADSGGAWTNTGGSASDFSVAAASGGRHLHTSAAVRHFSRLPLSIVRADQTVRIRVNALSATTSQFAGFVARYVDGNNLFRGELIFGVGGAISAQIVQTAAGGETLIASKATGLTHVAATWYQLRMQTGLTSVRLKAWLDGTAEPATWLIDGADSASVLANSGTHGLQSVRDVGNTNANATIDFDSYLMVDGPRSQFVGYVDQWPVEWADASETVSLVQITATGQLRRLAQSQSLKSALFRANTGQAYSATPLAVAYWPMEDGSDATQFASGLTTGQPMTFTDWRPGSDTSFAGSESLPTGGGEASFRASVPAYTTSTEWAVRLALKSPTPSTNTGVIAWSTPTSVIRLWVFVLKTDDTFTMQGYNSAGTDVLGSAAPTLNGTLFDRQLYVMANAVQNGGNIDWDVTVYAADGDTVGTSGSIAGTVGNITSLSHDAAPGLTAGGHVIGHVAVANDVSFNSSAYLANGYAGELTSDRLGRFAGEENLPIYFGEIVTGTTGTTVQTMGAQRTSNMLAQLREIEATEEGILFDGKEGQITILPRTSRQARTVDLTLDHDQGQIGWPFKAIRDDFLLRTEVTVNRVGGSRGAIASDATAVRAVGVYSDSVTINSNTDADLKPRASWRLNMGKTREIRYPEVPLDLTRNQSLISDWLDMDVGARIAVTNLPTQLPPDPLDLLVEGYTETLSSTVWRAVLNCSPARPWNVWTVLGGGNRGRLASAGSTLNSGINSSTTSLSVATVAGSLWKTGATSFDINIGGERMTVTNITGASSPQTFTATRSVNGIVKSHFATAAVGLWKAGVVAV